jgi:hypothetical protein
MAVEDILQIPEILHINGKDYKAEFDCKSYAILEQMTGKSIYKIQDLIPDNNLFLTDSIELLCASLIKHHTDAEIVEVRNFVQEHLSVVKQVNMPLIQAFYKGIAPPEVFAKVKELTDSIKTKVGEEDKKKVKRKV